MEHTGRKRSVGELGCPTGIETDSQFRYHSIRIDIVHYCPLEDILSDKRGSDDYTTENSYTTRLKLLIKTLREYNPALGEKVRFLKLPYMVRQYHIKDLALAVGTMPNLLHVDLPTGFYGDEAKTTILRAELQARCQNLRKMSYDHGSETSLQQLSTGQFWRRLEVLDLENLMIDPFVIRRAIGALPNLKALKLLGIRNIDDSIFVDHPRVPPFPALVELILEDIPGVTGAGIVLYLDKPVVRQTVNTLSFSKTGVLVAHLSAILRAAPRLSKLSVIDTVCAMLSSDTSPTSPEFSDNSLTARHNLANLISSSLEVLNYEILVGGSHVSFSESIAASYYDYLSASLLAGGLPNLTTLFVRDVNFTETLQILDLPPPPFAGGSFNRLSSSNPFSHSQNSSPSSRPFNKELLIYTKGSEEMSWDFNRVADSLPNFLPNGRPASGASFTQGFEQKARPMSSYGLTTTNGENGASWTSDIAGNGVRMSLMVSNGAGQFLGVPGGSGPDNRLSVASSMGGALRPGTANSMRSNLSGRGHWNKDSLGGGTDEWPSVQREDKRGSKYDIWR